MLRSTPLSILCLTALLGCGRSDQELPKGTPHDARSRLGAEPKGNGVAATPVEDETWAEALGKEITHGDVQLRVDSAEVRPVKLQARAGEGDPSPTKESYLVVSLTITNVGEKQKLEYTGWGSFAMELNGTPPKLIDEKRRAYKLITFGQEAAVEGRLNTANLVREQPKRDVLVFTAPPDDVRLVYLTLRGENIGAKEPIRLKLPLGQ